MTSPLQQNWIDIAKALNSEPNATVRCPQCENADLEVFDARVPGYDGVHERHVWCESCGARTAMLKPQGSARTRRTIKVMADYGAAPLWITEPSRVGNITPAELGVSEALATELAAWAAEYTATLNDDDPRESGFRDRDTELALLARGRELTERLAKELGPGNSVTFFHAGAAGTFNRWGEVRQQRSSAASDAPLMQDVTARKIAPVLALSGLVAVAGGFAFSHALVYVIAACIIASIVRPRGFLLYGVAAVVPTLVAVLYADVNATPLWKIALPCLSSGFVVWLWREKLPNGADKTAKGSRRSSIFWCALLTLFPFYPIAKTAWAELQTTRFCATVSKGDSITGLVERAAGYGLTVWSDEPRTSISGEHRPAQITAMEGWAFGRHFCGVEHDGKRVTKVSHTFLD
jgi:hypothetical protein